MAKEVTGEKYRGQFEPDADIFPAVILPGGGRKTCISQRSRRWCPGGGLLKREYERENSTNSRRALDGCP